MGCFQKEPDLNDLLADPIVQAVMSRDAVKEIELRGLLDRVRSSMGEPLCAGLDPTRAESSQG